MKRFWDDALVVDRPEGWGIALDGRPLKTPARAELAVPTALLAEAIRAEWADCGETIDPRAMPLTGLANAALDHPAAALGDSLARYAEADLLCYRASDPARLVERQAAAWDPLLGWARRRHDVDFVVTTGVIHVAQPEATVARLAHAVRVAGSAHAVRAAGGFALAGLAPIVTIGGSLVTALALFEEAVTLDQAWRAVTIDEAWQAEQWGEDAEATAALAARAADFAAGARFLALL